MLDTSSVLVRGNGPARSAVPRRPADCSPSRPSAARRLAAAFGALGLTFLALVVPSTCPRVLAPLLGGPESAELVIALTVLSAGAAGAVLAWATRGLDRRGAFGVVLSLIVAAVSLAVPFDFPAVRVLLIPVAVVLPAAIAPTPRALPAAS